MILRKEGKYLYSLLLPLPIPFAIHFLHSHTTYTYTMADPSSSSRVPVPQGQNPAQHTRGGSVQTVASWEGDRDFLPGLGVRPGSTRHEPSFAAAPAQQPPLQQRVYTTAEVERMCERYAANEREALQQRLNQTGQLLADSQRRVGELEDKMQEAIDTITDRDMEIVQMSRELSMLRLRVPAGSQQALQQHPRAPTQNFASLPTRPPPPPAAPRAPEMQQPRPQLSLGAVPFVPARPALPPPSPPHPQQQQALVVAPRQPIAGSSTQRPGQLAPPSPQRLLPGSPAHPDDVFDPSVADHMPWRPVDFGKKSVRELLEGAFGKVKGLVWSQGYVRIPQSRLRGERDFIGLCIKHLDKAAMAYKMLNEQPRYSRLVAGIINSLLVDKIFTQTALLSFPPDSEGVMAAFVTRYQAEKETAYPNPVMNDFARRSTIAENRADAAKDVQRLPRFWRWIQDKSRLIAEDILPEIHITISGDHRPYREELVRCVNELLRVHVRMLQDPSIYSMEFLGTGYAWVSERMLNRDPDLGGQQIADQRCPWVTQCMISPLVMEEKFERTPGGDKVFASKETLLKAEVTLCPRKGNLRQ